MFRFITTHLAGLPFPSRKRQTRQVKTRLYYIIESEHIFDIGYKHRTSNEEYKTWYLFQHRDHQDRTGCVADDLLSNAPHKQTP